MNKHVLKNAPSKLSLNVSCDLWEFHRARELEDRRLYLNGEIGVTDYGNDTYYAYTSVASFIVERIIDINRLDDGAEPQERDPIRLYINSPGGDVTEGFALISAIGLSKTPIYTINVGQWSSMAFLIGIAGHKRFSLPYAKFLMHDGSLFLCGTANKVKDEVKFDDRMEKEVVKPYVLAHSKMDEAEYDTIDYKEFYMLPEDALKHGFIDEIVKDIETIF